MKAEELMIGDWVLYDNEPHQIQEVLYGEVTIECWPKDLDDIAPIPLTAEILEKNGFVSEDKAHYGFCGTDNILELLEYETPFGIDGFDIVRTNKGVNENKQNYYIDHYFASIYSVHQLQHALRLCGIEKEIKL